MCTTFKIKVLALILLMSGKSVAQVDPQDSITVRGVIDTLRFNNLNNCSLALVNPVEEWGNCCIEVENNKIVGIECSSSFPGAQLALSVGNLTDIKWIKLGDYNHTIGGYIPKTLGNLQNLESFRAWNSSWIESIPPEIGNCTNLIEFVVGSPYLGGNIPETFCNLQRLRILEITGSQVFGPIPLCFGNHDSLEQIVLTQCPNYATFIPDTLCHVPSLTHLVFWGCNMYGEIPECLGYNENFIFLNIQTNHFTGEIAPSFKLRHVTIKAKENELTGIPILEQGDSVWFSSLQYNKLTFEDFEQSILNGMTSFFGTIHPQDSILYPLDTVVLIGTPALLSSLSPGDYNNYQWYKDSVAIPGANGPYLYTPAATYADSGTYTCHVWNDVVTPVKGLHLWRHCIHVKVVNSLSQQDLLQNTPGLFPNPAHCRVTIRNGSEPITTITITDLNGRIVRLSHPNQPVVLLDISDLPAGAYNVTVEAEKAKWSETMVVGE